MTKVIMLVSTHYGEPHKAGDVADVPERIAERWVQSGVAKFAEEREIENPETGEVIEKSVNYNSYKAGELQKIAEERDIDGWDSMKKADLVKALNEDDDANAEG